MKIVTVKKVHTHCINNKKFFLDLEKYQKVIKRIVDRNPKVYAGWHMILATLHDKKFEDWNFKKKSHTTVWTLKHSF